MGYSLLQQFDLEEDITCRCATCNFKYKHSKLLTTLILVSLIVPILWVFPLSLLGYQRFKYTKSQKVTDFAHHESNRVHTKSQFFYLVIATIIYFILLSFIIVGAILYTQSDVEGYDSSKINLVYLL